MSGGTMEVFTDFPAIQIYTGAKLHAPYKPNQGIAIEPEFYPDSPNHPNFPSTVLHPGEKFAKYVEYRFS
jgi:aldose 1-epimerase